MALQAIGEEHFYDSADFEAVKAAEFRIWGRRGKNPKTNEFKEPLIGLALSGGGIRSASFALGVMQALFAFYAFDKFNYLSTVSGGGYIGGALTYFRNTFAGGRDPNKPWFPFGYQPPQGADKVKTMGARTSLMQSQPAPPRQAEPNAPRPTDGEDEKEDKEELVRKNFMSGKVIAFLRQHAGYMTPSQQVGGASLAAGVTRGLVSTLLPYFAILSGLFGLLIWGGFFDRYADLKQFWIAETCPSASVQKQATDCAEAACTALAGCLANPCATPARAIFERAESKRDSQAG